MGRLPSKLSSLSIRKQHSAADGVPAEQLPNNTEDARVEKTVRERVRMVVLAGGAGSEFDLHWRSVSLDGDATTTTDAPRESDVDAYGGNGEIELTKEMSYSVDDVGAVDDSNKIPMLAGWLVVMKKGTLHSDKFKLVDRKLFVLDDDNKRLLIANDENIQKAKAINYSDIEQVFGTHMDKQYIMTFVYRSRRGLRTAYYRTVREQMPYQPNYMETAMVRWLCALRYRAKLYDLSLWSHADQAKHAALWAQSVFRMKKAKSKKDKLERVLSQESGVLSRINSRLLKGETPEQTKARIVEQVLDGPEDPVADEKENKSTGIGALLSEAASLTSAVASDFVNLALTPIGLGTIPEDDKRTSRKKRSLRGRK